MIDRIPPQALDVERTVLGSILMDKDAAANAFELLDEDIFYSGQNIRVFKCMKELFNRNVPIDIVTVREELKKKQWLDNIGGEAYLGEIAECISTPENIKHYTDILIDKARRRAAIKASAEIQSNVFNEDMPCSELAIRSEQAISLAFDIKRKHYIKSAYDVMLEVGTEIDRMRTQGGRIGITSGYKGLDDTIGGFENGDFIVIAGRPSMGKTAFSLCMALRQAIVHQVPVAIFSLEMSTKSIGQRMLSIESGISLYKIRYGYVNNTEMEKLAITEGKIQAAPIYFDETPSPTTTELKAKIYKLKRKYNIQLVYVDYLQLIHSLSTDPVHGTTLISQSLKSIAKEFMIPTIALSQLSRLSVTRGKNHRPRLEDLRQSGAIEQDADIVIFIHREFVYTKAEEDKMNADIIIGKQRQGPTGDVKMMWKAENTNFYEPDECPEAQWL